MCFRTGHVDSEYKLAAKFLPGLVDRVCKLAVNFRTGYVDSLLQNWTCGQRRQTIR